MLSQIRVFFFDGSVQRLTKPDISQDSEHVFFHVAIWIFQMQKIQTFLVIQLFPELLGAKEYKDQVSVSPIVANKWLHIAVVVDRGAPCSANDDPSFVQCSRIEAGLGFSDEWYFLIHGYNRPVILYRFCMILPSAIKGY